jgi:hypothetical protein
MPALRPRVITTEELDLSEKPAPTGPGLGTAIAIKEDGYFAKVVKYIPSEVVAVYVLLTGLISTLDAESHQAFWEWVVLGCMLPLSFLYMLRATREEAKTTPWIQIVIAPIAMASWAFALGGPFVHFEWYNAAVGAIVMILLAACFPLLEELPGARKKRLH